MPNMCNNKKDNINAVNNNSSQKWLLSNHSHVHLLPQSRQDEDYRDFELSQNVQAYTWRFT